MKLVPLLAGSFTSTVRARGLDYKRQRLVRITHGTPTELTARVRGTENYDVWLSLSGSTLHSSCECPYFHDQGLCKHLWAAILAADEQGYLTDAAALGNRLKLLDDPAGEDDLADFFEPEPLRPPARPVAQAPPKPSAWRKQLDEINDLAVLRDQPIRDWPDTRRILYVVDISSTLQSGTLTLSLLMQDRKAKGEGWNKHKEIKLPRRAIPHLPDSIDRELLAMITGGRQHFSWSLDAAYEVVQPHLQLPEPLATRAVQLAAGTGRLFIRQNQWADQLAPLAWDDGEPWVFELAVDRVPGQKTWMLKGALRRGEEQMELSKPQLLTQGGLVFADGRAARLDAKAPFPWISHLRRNLGIEVPDKDKDAFLAALLETSHQAHVAVPEELKYEEEQGTPRPLLRVRSHKFNQWTPERLRAQLSYLYGTREVADANKQSAIFDTNDRRLLRRDLDAEAAARRRLAELGLKRLPGDWQRQEPEWDLAPAHLPGAVRVLIQEGWQIEAEGKTFRRPGSTQVSVTSGIDWFELHGTVDYGDVSANLPELLEALRKGDGMVRLSDGTFGLLPEDWLTKFGQIAGLGTNEKDHVRFKQNQAGLLDALLAAQPEASFDEVFARARDRLRQFEGVRAVDQPAGFTGQLREYQREGLGWLHFLREFGFGGCLADDMGVGKTAQVLALLETRRELRVNDETPPSLVVVPRSLVFNWIQEAARFTPQLRLLDYSGKGRTGADLSQYDVLITTYGTLRRDAVRLKDVAFDYIVLDEAQAIKNASTESAKAVRLLKGQHKLAMSGTPIENHLGELWSLFEFLNPGMLGSSSVLKLAGSAARNPSEDTVELLARAVRPLILRRTKKQVAKELPERTEQTLFCEMNAAQKKQYNELRQHYRLSLLTKVDQSGLNRSKMHVLEALLRLRQAACHPGLLDHKRIGEPSAKLDMLMEQLEELLQEGHKALVFSQFTSLLAIVRQRLEAQKLQYEYLDGQTRDRQERVEQFQNDPDCKLFLISLKAGGLGLNLTAADYVFLLDPWWNPAVEAQAIDRAHRIGQTQQVFAYRLITKDTVEEKVLELQKTKKHLADAILTADNSLLRDLSREDLELLLS